MTTTPIDLEAITLEDIRAGAFDGRPVTVLGLARSGIALVRYLHDMGARVTVYDGRNAAALDGSIAQLDDRQVELRLGPDVDPASTWAQASRW